MTCACAGQADRRRSISQAGWAVRTTGSTSRRSKRARRSAAKRRSTALARPAAGTLPRRRTASTAACTVASGALREYSIWCAAHTSSACTAGSIARGRATSTATAGASLKYQRRVPSAMARIAARSGMPSAARSAASADSPRERTASTARAAPASAGAPGAQGVLTKALPQEGATVGEVARRNAPAARQLHLGHGQHALPAPDREVIVTYREDRPGFDAIRARMRHVSVTFVCPRCVDAQLLPGKEGLCHGPGAERPDPAADGGGILAPVDARLRLVDLGRIGDPLLRLRFGA